MGINSPDYDAPLKFDCVQEEEEEDTEETKVSSNSLKIFVVIKHKKLLFYYFSKTSNNSLMSLKTRFYEIRHSKFLRNLRPKNLGP